MEAAAVQWQDGGSTEVTEEWTPGNGSTIAKCRQLLLKAWLEGKEENIASIN